MCGICHGLGDFGAHAPNSKESTPTGCLAFRFRFPPRNGHGVRAVYELCDCNKQIYSCHRREHLSMCKGKQRPTATSVCHVGQDSLRLSGGGGHKNAYSLLMTLSADLKVVFIDEMGRWGNQKIDMCPIVPLSPPPKHPWSASLTCPGVRGVGWGSTGTLFLEEAPAVVLRPTGFICISITCTTSCVIHVSSFLIRTCSGPRSVYVF